VAEGYDSAAKWIEAQDLKELLLRIKDHEVYDTEVFSNLLKEGKQQG